MRGEERLDPARTGHAEAVDVDPPTPAARYSKREVGQGLDASLAQHCGYARLKPEVDPVADQGDGNGALAELLDGGSHGACGRGAFAGRSGEELGQVVTVARPGEGRDVTADRPDDAARRLTGRPSVTEIPRSPRPSTTAPRAMPGVPRAPPRQAATADVAVTDRLVFHREQFTPLEALCR
jgi:hypothetical protein